MHTTPARYRAILLPALLIVGLFGASSVSAADETAPARPAPTVAGTGVLAATGAGQVRLAGGYLLTGSLEGGTLAVRGVDPWSTIRVTGWISKTRLADGTVLYRFGDGVGHYRVAGRTIATTIESDVIRLRAAGHGRAWLAGTGSYWVNGRGPLAWTEPGVDAAF